MESGTSGRTVSEALPSGKPANAAGLSSRLEALPLGRWHASMMTLCCLGILFDAYDSLILSVSLPKLMTEWQIPQVQVGMLGSASFVGMMIGAILFGILADKIGRWKVFQITLLIYALLTGVCALATGFTSMLILRIMVGIGLGGLVPVDSAYLTEYIPSKYRGRFMTWLNVFFPFGNTLAYVVGFLIVAPYSWRWAFILGAVPAILVVFLRRSLPESVRYLVEKGRIEEAVRIVDKIEQSTLKKTTVPFNDAVEREKLAKSGEPAAKGSVVDLFKGGVARSTIVVSVVWFCLAYSVYSVLIWFPILLIKELGYGLALGLKFLAVAALIGGLGQVFAGFAYDRIPRRVTITVVFLLYGVFSYLLFWYGRDAATGQVLLIIMMIFASCSWGIVYAYTPENFPTRLRGTGAGFAGAIGRVAGILGPTLVGVIYSAAGVNWVLHVNMILLILAVITVLTVGRETGRKTLEEISHEMGIKE